MSASSPAANSVALAPAGPTLNPRFGVPATEPQIQRTVDALRANGMEAVVVSNRAEAVGAVLGLVAEGSQILDVSSQTLASLGLNELLADPGKFRNIRPELMRLRADQAADAQRKLGSSPDVVVGSVHALTETGSAVIASASGSQLAPYVSGAGRVIWVVGTQKIVPDLEAAFQRIQEYTLPLESERAQKAYGRGSFVAKLLVIHREFTPGRIHVVLVRENLGF